MHRSGTKLTYEDYVLIPNDGERHEIVGGEHFVNPSPRPVHQSVSACLTAELVVAIQYTGLGRVFAAPFAVHLSKHDIVQPDLVVILQDRLSILTPTKAKGSPDLLIEILSPSTTRHDRVRKRRLYERSGVREFWIVDPAEHAVEQLVLEDVGYRLAATCSESVTLHVLPSVTLELPKVW